MRKVNIDKKTDKITIYPWKEGMCDPLIIKWKEKQDWDEVLKKNKLNTYFPSHLWSNYAAYYFNEESYLSNYFQFEFPFSVCFYEFPNHFLISYAEIMEFNDIKNCCCVPSNLLIISQFMREELVPLAKIFIVERIIKDDALRQDIEDVQKDKYKEERKKRNEEREKINDQ